LEGRVQSLYAEHYVYHQLLGRDADGELEEEKSSNVKR